MKSYLTWGTLLIGGIFQCPTAHCQLTISAPKAQAAPSSDQVRKRLNQILYWQLADELKLSAKAEKSMAIVIEEIQKKREEALSLRSQAMTQLKVEPSSQDSLKKLHKALLQMATLDLEEYERLEKVLGPQTLGQFYLVRDKVAEKISQSLNSSPSK